MKISSSVFIKSSSNSSECPNENLPEFAFIGRSNVGKSSLINCLTGSKKLAKISATPGKTLLINHFLINNKWYLVDLPGFGYAKRSKKEIKKIGIINLKHGDYEYPITFQLIKDGRKNKVFKKKIYQNIKITMVHGTKDKSVPINYSRKVLKIFRNAKKKLVIVKNGDHSLSSPRWLNLLKKELKLIIS